jgi:GTP-binding protein
MVHQVVFRQRAYEWSQLGYKGKPEYAFIGRSNVGKSTLINQVVKQPNLAQTSQQPGKTRHIDLFEVDQTWNLVDLPGYGYAKISKQAREAWLRMMEGYFLNRPNLATLFLLIDSSIPPKDVDLEFAYWLGLHEIPFSLVYTKADKAKPGAVQANIQEFEAKMAEEWEELPPTFQTSAKNGHGTNALLQYIQGINKELSTS